MNTKDLIQTFSDPLSTLYYLCIAIALSFLIAYTYKKTHKSVSYSQSFVVSLVMLLPLVALIINVVNNNVARAIGVFGAFSVTRFRTPIKDSRDMIYIFWSLAVGLAIGSAEISIAITSSFAMSILAHFLHFINFGNASNFDHLLIYSLDTKKSRLQNIENVIKPLVKGKETINIQSDKTGTHLEISTNIKLKKNTNVDSLVKILQSEKGIREISITPLQNSIEFWTPNVTNKDE